MRLLVTRPEPDATHTAQALRARGHEVLVAPLLRTETIDVEFKGPYGAVLMTSANAARAIATHRRSAELQGLPVYTVGNRTAGAAREAGLTNVDSADGALADLVRLTAARFAGTRKPLLYLAGEDRAGDLAGELAAHGIAVETVVIYRVVAIDPKTHAVTLWHAFPNPTGRDGIDGIGPILPSQDSLGTRRSISRTTVSPMRWRLRYGMRARSGFRSHRAQTRRPCWGYSEISCRAARIAVWRCDT